MGNIVLGNSGPLFLGRLGPQSASLAQWVVALGPVPHKAIWHVLLRLLQVAILRHVISVIVMLISCEC